LQLSKAKQEVSTLALAASAFHMLPPPIGYLHGN
jgi:hypothetical protein